jgi:hypothetical protein
MTITTIQDGEINTKLVGLLAVCITVSLDHYRLYWDEEGLTFGLKFGIPEHCSSMIVTNINFYTSQFCILMQKSYMNRIWH